MGYHFCQQMVYDKGKMFDPKGETPRINFSLGPLVSPHGSTVSRCFAIPGHLLDVWFQLAKYLGTGGLSSVCV